MSIILDQFIHTLVESGLMTKGEVLAFIDGLAPDDRPADGETLAKLLLQHKKLTKFQAQAVYQSKIKGLVVGNYVVLDKIGKGGMGHVYKARHKRMKRNVALKILPSHISRQRGAVERFRREVVAAARLTHPNIVTAYDADEANGVHFLVMELVEGTDLSKLVSSQGAVSVAKAIAYVRQVADGLQYAHEAGIVHRDIKPSNLLLSNSGEIKILDMGLARFEREICESTAAESLTQSGQVMGTLDYMAPEQAEDTHNASVQADIYSLGCTLYFLLAGKNVFDGETMAVKIVAHLEHPIPSLRDQRTDVSEQLDQAFQKMLAKRPEDRQQSMAEVARDLEACLGPGLIPQSTTSTSFESASEYTTVADLPTPPEVIVAPTPPPVQPDKSDSHERDWLKEELPESPTSFRPVSPDTKRSKWLRCIPALIGAALVTALLISMLTVLRRDRSTEDRVAGNGDKTSLSDTPGGVLEANLPSHTRANTSVLSVALDDPDWTWSAPQNLGAAVNSTWRDAGPELLDNGRVLLFFSFRPEGYGSADLWYCERDRESQEFMDAVNMGAVINSPVAELSPSLSDDGLLLLFAADRPGGYGNLDIWMCERKGIDDDFGNPTNLGVNVNSQAMEDSPCLSADGRWLAFFSDRLQTPGQQDLWVSTRANSQNQFDQPQKLDAAVNTEHAEIAPDSKGQSHPILYSTTRPGGYGGHDLWIACPSDSSQYENVMNLGAIINSSYDDTDPHLSDDGKTLFFASDRPGGIGDVDIWMAHRVPRKR